MNRLLLFPALLTLYFQFITAEIAAQVPLPPYLQWEGKSVSLISLINDKWITPSEKSGFERTPDYNETKVWLQKLVKASPYLSITTVGKTAGGHDILMVRASKDKAFLKGAVTDKPLLLIQCGIHAGEIDGKDAGLMLLRDIAQKGKHYLIDKVNLLFIPILNVDGHERTSPYNRINQRGPSNMGWRTNAQNLNLNRDYVKLDTREIRSMIEVINKYHPDLYFDIHVTDGVDYQYDITYGFHTEAHSPSIGKWLTANFRPFVDSALTGMGHIPGPLMFPVNDKDFTAGNLDFIFPPEFSHAYGDLINLPTILVENHSLKPYRQRVLGTYVFMEAALKLLAAKSASLKTAVHQDKSHISKNIPLSFVLPNDTASQSLNAPWNASPSSATEDSMILLGIQSAEVTSPVTGGKYVQWLGGATTMKIPVHKNNRPANYVTKPKAWLLPPGYDELVERLKIHGLKMSVLDTAEMINVQMLRVINPQFNRTLNEGHFKVKAGFETETGIRLFPKGTVRIPSDQPLSNLAAFLLSPQCESSLFQWGFFPGLFTRTEYIEGYIMEPYAKQMLDKSPQLQKDFELFKKNNPSQATNQRAILEWFYKQTPFYDKNYLLYPVAGEM